MKAKYSKNQVRAAGEVLACASSTSEECQRAYAVVTYWRTAHDNPMRAMSDILEALAKEREDVVVASRLKRIDTIIGKLKRPGCTHKLNSMNDIAGCRIILPSLSEVADASKKLSALASCLANKTKDYIAYPKGSGYRGIHHIHRFDNPEYGYAGLSVETQVRTQLQHAWATSVELYDILTQGKLKFGESSSDVARYFLLASEYLAQFDEGVLGLGQARRFEHFTELHALDSKLGICDLMRAYSKSVTVNKGEGHPSDGYFFLEADFDNQWVGIRPFSESDIDDAGREYTELEASKEPGLDYLLVRASSIEQLERAYPNYCSDVSLFLDYMEPLKGN